MPQLREATDESWVPGGNECRMSHPKKDMASSHYRDTFPSPITPTPRTCRVHTTNASGHLQLFLHWMTYNYCHDKCGILTSFTNSVVVALENIVLINVVFEMLLMLYECCPQFPQQLYLPNSLGNPVKRTTRLAKWHKS